MTVEDREALVHELLDTDADYQRLHAEHQECERRLEELQDSARLSQEDELEGKRIKLHKLALKDRMEQILRTHEGARVTA